MKNKKLTGFVLSLLGIIFGVLETGYFGWHFRPSCNAELICDFISEIIFFVGLYIFTLSVLEGEKE